MELFTDEHTPPAPTPTQRLNKAAKKEHKLAKKLNRLQAEHTKQVEDKDKAEKELEIKKANTQHTAQAYEEAKKRVDDTRAENHQNSLSRQKRQASLHGSAVQ